MGAEFICIGLGMFHAIGRVIERCFRQARYLEPITLAFRNWFTICRNRYICNNIDSLPIYSRSGCFYSRTYFTGFDYGLLHWRRTYKSNSVVQFYFRFRHVHRFGYGWNFSQFLFLEIWIFYLSSTYCVHAYCFNENA